METDAALWRASLDGDREAFGRIVARYQNLLCSLAYSALGDVGRSEDVAQEALVVAWRQLAELREPDKLKAWLCGIVRNLAKHARRRESRGQFAPTAALAGAAEPATGDPTPLEQSIRDEEQAVVWSALEAMEQEYREPLVLFYRGQLSVAEVAAQLELSEEAARQRLSRGRKRLRADVMAVVERGLRASRPAAAFTIAVIAALPAAAPQAMSAGLAATAAKGKAAALASVPIALWGAILGPLLGILGAAIGVRAGLKSTKSPRERQFMIRMVWICLALVTGMLVIQGLMIYFVPHWQRAGGVQAVVWTLYICGLIPLIHWGNTRQQQIREEDGTAVVGQSSPLDDVPARAMWGALAGAMFGPSAWLVPMGILAGDWLAPLVAIALVAGGSIVIGRWYAHSTLRGRKWLAGTAATTVVGAVTIATATLRWHDWMAASPAHPANDYPLSVVNLAVGCLCAAMIAWCLFAYRQVRRRGGSR